MRKSVPSKGNCGRDLEKNYTMRAAGGIILFRQEKGGGLHSLVVKHAAHGGWGFPKGKCEKGETIRETACREVREETGLDCLIIADIGYTAYSFESKKGKQVDKRVDWYLMAIEGESEPTHPEEIEAIVTPSLAQLSEHLSYANDRDLLARAMPQIEEVAPRIIVREETG